MTKKEYNKDNPTKILVSKLDERLTMFGWNMM